MNVRLNWRRCCYASLLAAIAAVATSPQAIAAIDNSWSQFHGGNSFAGSATSGPDLRIYNTPRFQVGSDLGAYGFGANSSSPIVMNNKVFAYSQSGAMSAFSELNGSFLWSTPIEGAAFGSWSSPSADAASNSVYMGSGSYVYRLDAITGQQLWASQLTEYGGTGETYAQVVNAAPTIVPGLGLNGEGLVFQHTYGSFGGGTRLHAFNVADGSLAWHYDTPGQGQGEVAYNPSNSLLYAISNGTGSWANGRGGIIALDAATGVKEWESADSYFAFSFGGIAYDAANNRVVAGGYSFYSYAGMLVVDGDTGATISYTGDEVAPSGDYRPTIGDDNLIYVTGAEFQDGPYIYAFDATTGDIVWQVGEQYADSWGGWTHSLIYANDIGDGTDVVYAADQNYFPGNRYGMFDADTGALLQTLPIGGGPGALANGNLYILTNDGQLVAFGPAVPEPATIGLALGTGCFALMLRRPKKRSSFLQGSLVRTGVTSAILITAFAGACQLATAAYVYDPNDFAVEVVSATGTFGFSPYDDPAAILGRPATDFHDEYGDGTNHRVKIVEPAYWTSPTGEKLITTLDIDFGTFAGSQITVRMGRKVENDPRNPYGIDLNVFGNAFFVAGGGGFINDSTNMNELPMGGSGFLEPLKVSVSQDGTTWHTFESGPYGDDMFPTNGYVWDRANATWTDEMTDPTMPVNPALTESDFVGTAADALDLYRSTFGNQTYHSAGGTGFDIGLLGLDWIEYVRFEAVTNGTDFDTIFDGDGDFWGGEIDAVADVAPIIPEPMSMMLVGTAALLVVATGRRRESSALLVMGLVSFASSQSFADSPYATELISQNGAYGSQSLYNDPNAVLGEPTSLAVNAAFPPVANVPFHIKIVEPAYNRDMNANKVITTLSRRNDGGSFTYGSITVKFDHQVYDDPVNPYGIDLNVFGNAFYVGGGTEGGYVSDTTDMRSYYLAGGIFAEPVVISVSPDNVNWYTYSDGPYGDTAFPTQGFEWDAEQHDDTGNGWTDQKMDFTKPVNPTLDSVLGADGPAIYVADALQIYDRSGGGTGIDLAESGFEWIQYIRVNSTAEFRDGEIDAFADVRPMQVGDSLSITPTNVTDGALLYFQSTADLTQTAIRAEFTEIGDLGRITTDVVTDETALASLTQGVLANYQLEVGSLVDGEAVAFTANLQLQPGIGYAGDGSDLSVLSWIEDEWQSIPFTFDATAAMAVLTDWSQSLSLLAIVQSSNLPGDFDRDGDVDGRDFLTWQRNPGIGHLADWQANYGQPNDLLASVAAIPEPAALALALSSCLTLFCRRSEH